MQTTSYFNHTTGALRQVFEDGILVEQTCCECRRDLPFFKYAECNGTPTRRDTKCRTCKNRLYRRRRAAGRKAAYAARLMEASR